MTDENDGQDITITLTILSPERAELRTIGLGVDTSPTLLLTMGVDEEGDVKIELTTGAPFEATDKGIGEIASILETYSEGIRSPEFIEAWKATQS